MIGKFCILRTYSAGVHMGIVAELCSSAGGTSAIVHDCRRLWSWTKAFTLNEISQEGASEESRISNAVPEILLTEVIEVIPCSEKATANLRRSRNR